MTKTEYRSLAIILDGLVMEAMHYSTLAKEAGSTTETAATLYHVEPRLQQALSLCKTMQALNSSKIIQEKSI